MIETRRTSLERVVPPQAQRSLCATGVPPRPYNTHGQRGRRDLGFRDEWDGRSASGGERQYMSIIDCDEQMLLERFPSVLNLLLADQTTRRKILWGTEDYEHLGRGFLATDEILAERITARNTGIIRPRVAKTQINKHGRTKGRAEVFTPSWLCNEQNNSVDEAWFGRPNVFNRAIEGGWRTTRVPVEFESVGTRTWRHYVDDRRLEVACGEGPYLVSRYDTTTGVLISPDRRIGLLDRKMRVVLENTSGEVEWLRWSLRAYQSTYGFELQGDSLLLARENLLASYFDYMRQALDRLPSKGELLKIARVISWNVWQMDGLTGTIPFHSPQDPAQTPRLFDLPLLDHSADPCLIRDWRSKKTLSFSSLTHRNLPG